MRYILNAIIALTLLFSCGGIRYSHIYPEAKDFHPNTLAILPADPGSYEEARGIIDEIMAGDIAARGWFRDVVAGETVKRQIAANEALRAALSEYMTKMATVNYSDPGLAAMIGKTTSTEAFLITYVDFWHYAREGEDKVAKVGLSMKLVDASNGKIVWKAGHHEIEDYLFIRPKLENVASRLVNKMFNEMPH
jgi:hypothetical protein